jgi:hypothetical protein
VTVVDVVATTAPVFIRKVSEQCAVIDVNSILYVPPEEEIVWFKVTGTRWPSDRAASGIQFPQKRSIQEAPPVLEFVNARGTLSCRDSMSFLQNRCEEFSQNM